MAIKITTDAYCDLNHVLELLPGRVYDEHSSPTLQQAENLIIDKKRQIDSVLRSLGYTLPITSTDDLDLLAGINKIGAAYMIENATLLKGGEASEIADKYEEQYDKLLAMLKDGEIGLETETGDSEGPDSNDDLSSSGIRSEPIFTMSKTDRNKQF